MKNFKNEYYLTGSDILNELFGMPALDGKKNTYMKTDIKENDDEYLFEIDMPGVNKENININFEEGYLTVSVNCEEEKEDTKGNYVCRERFFEKKERSYYLGEVDEELVKAKLDNGVLTISVPKKKEVEKNKKMITIE